jgi:hypothetical protein
MQKIIYNNINSRFTFNNIWSLLTKFWINEVLNKKEYTKIWLTIIVNNSNNKSFTLINNLPFNLNGYSDVLIVLRLVFKRISIICDKDVINSIVFKYNFEYKDDYKWDLYITNILLYIFLILIIIISLLCTFIVFLILFQSYNIEYIDKEILNYAYESIKDYNCKEFNQVTSKRFIFSPFIDLLNGNTNYPSRFVSTNLNYFNEFKPLYYKDNMFEDNTSLLKTILRINNRLEEYESLVQDLMQIITSKP